MLHFIYKDSLTEDVESVSSSSSCPSPVSETLTAKLLAAADRYGLERLKLMCESHICNDIAVNSVAEILALADRCHASELKAVCLRFASENLAGMPSGFTYGIFLKIRVFWKEKKKKMNKFFLNASSEMLTKVAFH
jgi:speckle-type POZ protein